MSIPTDPTEILGLNHAEKRIIQATSKMALSMSAIARKARIPRSSIPYMIQKLEERGFIKAIRHEKRLLWKADMAKPLRVLGKMPTNTFSGGQNFLNSGAGVVTYHGSAAILNLLSKMGDLPKNTRVYGFQPDKSIRNAIRKSSLKELLKLNAGIKKKALIVEGIVHEKSVESMLKDLGKEKGQKLLESFIGRLEDYVKVPDDFANVEAEIYIFGGAAHIINWDKEIAIEIHDKDMVALLTAMLSCVKEFGQRYSQNEKIKRYSPKYASTTSRRAKTSEGLPSANNSPESRT